MQIMSKVVSLWVHKKKQLSTKPGYKLIFLTSWVKTIQTRLFAL